jgi:two-component system, cell cycle response regulator DivK
MKPGFYPRQGANPMKTILLIEDNLANRILIERALQPHGYQIAHAADGETGLHMAQANPPDLVLVDMGLPDLDGQTVIAYLKQTPGLDGVPIVIITAWPEEKALEMAERYEANGCITKPLDIRLFPQQIAQFFPDELDSR